MTPQGTLHIKTLQKLLTKESLTYYFCNLLCAEMIWFPNRLLIWNTHFSARHIAQNSKKVKLISKYKIRLRGLVF